MNELIKQAAEDKYSHFKGFDNDKTFNQMVNQHINEVTHFLSFAKEKGFELVRVDGESEEVLKELHDIWMNQANKTAMDCMIIAYALGAAKERERMGKFAEWASSVSGYDYNEVTSEWLKIKKTSQYSIDRFGDSPQIDDYDYKTTSELIEIFNTQNKEG